tara:strand:- start:227 stop:1129 length:903 start_codon:yes stop_codon:yes gene_type:complete
MSSKSKINVVLTCAMKSGSTWLRDLLNQHPAINVLQSNREFFSEKKLIISNEELISSSLNILRHNLPASYQLLEKDKQEVDSLYIHLLNYPKIYHDYNPNMKFISLLREPVSRTFSHFKHHIEKISDVINWKEYSKRGVPIEGLFHPMAIDHKSLTFDINKDFQLRKKAYTEKKVGWIHKSMYYSSLKGYFNFYSLENFFLYPMEPAVSDPNSFLREVLLFLDSNVDFVFEKSDRKVNVSRQAKTKRFLNPFRDKEKSFIRMNEETLHSIDEIFKDDIYKLSEKTDIDFSSEWEKSTKIR